MMPFDENVVSRISVPGCLKIIFAGESCSEFLVFLFANSLVTLFILQMSPVLTFDGVCVKGKLLV